MISKRRIENTLNTIKHPAIDATLKELGMLENVKIKNNKVSLKIFFPFEGVPIKPIIFNSIKKALKAIGVEKVKIQEGVMNEKERNKFLAIEQEKWKGMADPAL